MRGFFGPYQNVVTVAVRIPCGQLIGHFNENDTASNKYVVFDSPSCRQI